MGTNIISSKKTKTKKQKDKLQPFLHKFHGIVSQQMYRTSSTATNKVTNSDDL